MITPEPLSSTIITRNQVYYYVSTTKQKPDIKK